VCELLQSSSSLPPSTHSASSCSQVQQFLEHYYQQLEADLNGFAGLRITTPTGAALLQGDSGTAAPAGATNGHPAHSTARSLAEVLNLKQHQASAIPPPKPLRDYTAEIDGTPSSVRVQSNGSVSSAFDVMHVSSASAPGVKLEEGAESEEEQQGDEEGDAEEADEEEEEDVDSRSSEEDDEDYSESSRKSKQQNKKKGVLTSMFSSRQSKSGRAVKRRTKEDEEQEDEDDEFGDDEEASEGGGRGARNRRSNRSDSPKARRSKLPLHTTNTLRGWALAHVHHPFPVDAEKKELATMCKLNFKQVSDWFTNNRKVKSTAAVVCSGVLFDRALQMLMLAPVCSLSSPPS
jgi:hypothetical protein